MSQISITVDGKAVQVESDQKPTHLYAENKEIVVCKINGTLKDLWTDLVDGDIVEGISISSPEGLAVLRHSTAHVMAQAVQQIFSDTRLGIGPPITEGFYYDFDVAEPFTPEDLKAIEKQMERIIRSGQRFMRRVVSDDEAREELAREPFKLELIGLKGGNTGDDNESVEVGGAELTIYDNVDPATGETVWKDLCRGPHVPSTRMIGNGFALTRLAAAYWRGSEKNPQLQRIYGTAWPTKDELRAYQERIEEALKRDHRKLGVELDLFSFPEAPHDGGLLTSSPRGIRLRIRLHTTHHQVESV